MKNIALTWWWTWGHVFPLLSIYNYLKDDKNLNFIWFWESWWLEEKIAEENNIKFIDVPVWKIRRYFDIKNFYEPLKNISWIIWWIYYLISNNIEIIFSKWGYVSFPLCIAWFLLRKKIYIHESDYVWWLTNKLITKIADKIFYTFPNEKIDWVKNILIWQILNPELVQNIDIAQELKDNDKLEILVIAWSQWSTTIFKSLKNILNNLIDINFTIILWDKNLHFKEEFKYFNNVKLYDFVSQRELSKIYEKTDIAISRWWATTLWELYFFWIHTIIIPLSTSAQNHQLKNAKFFEKNFWSIFIEESDQLDLELFRLLNKYKNLRKKWLNLTGFFDWLKKIKDEILR